MDKVKGRPRVFCKDREDVKLTRGTEPTPNTHDFIVYGNGPDRVFIGGGLGDTMEKGNLWHTISTTSDATVSDWEMSW